MTEHPVQSPSLCVFREGLKTEIVCLPSSFLCVKEVWNFKMHFLKEYSVSFELVHIIEYLDMHDRGVKTCGSLLSVLIYQLYWSGDDVSLPLSL